MDGSAGAHLVVIVLLIAVLLLIIILLPIGSGSSSSPRCCSDRLVFLLNTIEVFRVRCVLSS